MNAIRRVVVAALLAVWCFPAASLAKSAPAEPAPLSAPMPPTGTAANSETYEAEVKDLAAREQKAPELQDFKGGAAVYIGGATLVLVILLLILIV